MNALAPEKPDDIVAQLTIAITSSLADIRESWAKLEAEGLMTVYQSYAWCEAWIDRVGRPRGITPLIVSASDHNNNVVFILPLQLRRARGLKVIECLTAPQAGYGFGLFANSFIAQGANAWFARHFDCVIAALPKHDVLCLAELPATVHRLPNPMLAVRHFRGANQSHIMDLSERFDILYEQRRSSESRRGNRKRDHRLAALGDITFDIPQSKEQRKQTLETMFQHQQERLSEAGIHDVFKSDERAFITSLADAQTPDGPLLRPYCLRLDGKILAVVLGALHRKTFWALIASIAPVTARKYSPGDYALRAMIKSLCDDGTQTIDFSAGDSVYKLHWSNREVPLLFIIRANTLKGLPVAFYLLMREKAKGFAKRTPVLNDMLFALRRMLRGRKVSH
jgi:CelD/BcsL family acetyltransferase involved in cellulose biosynthesis